MGFGPVESLVCSPGVRCMGCSQLLPEAEQAVAWISVFLPSLVMWEVWPLIPGLLHGEVWRTSCLVLVGASFECSPAVY